MCHEALPDATRTYVDRRKVTEERKEKTTELTQIIIIIFMSLV